MVDITQVQTYAIPKSIIELQEANNALENSNVELKANNSNMALGLVGAIAFGLIIYVGLNNKLNEQRKEFT